MLTYILISDIMYFVKQIEFDFVFITSNVVGVANVNEIHAHN